MTSKRTLVLGASTNPSRYSNMAVHRLLEKGHEVVPVGIRKGEIAGKRIVNDFSAPQKDIDTITLYLGPKNQHGYYEYILGTNPKRVIFNPGTINPEFMEVLEKKQIEVVDACTLVMLSANTY